MDAKDKEASAPPSCGSSVIELYNEERPHGAIGNKVPIMLTKPGGVTSPSPCAKPENCAFGRSNVGDLIKSRENPAPGGPRSGSRAFFIGIYSHTEISPFITARPWAARIAENLGHPNCRTTSRTRASYAF